MYYIELLYRISFGYEWNFYDYYRSINDILAISDIVYYIRGKNDFSKVSKNLTRYQI